MTEQQKTDNQVTQETEKRKLSETLWMIGKYIIGIALIIIGALLVWFWRSAVWTVFKGCIGLFLVLVGLIFIAIARD